MRSSVTPSSPSSSSRVSLRHLLAAYTQLWYHDVDPSECREFCALALLSHLLCGSSPDFLSFNACYSSLPHRIRASPEVSQAITIAQCFLSDNIVRLFERLHAASYLVVVMLASRLADARCRCVKLLASVKLKLPFDMVIRCIAVRAQRSYPQISLSFFKTSRSLPPSTRTTRARQLHLARAVQAARRISLIISSLRLQPASLRIRPRFRS